ARHSAAASSASRPSRFMRRSPVSSRRLALSTVDSRLPARHGRPMSTVFPDVTTAGVILAGGLASRMGGRDKAFAAVDGEPIAVRTVGLFQRLFPQVIVATNRPERFAGLAVETVADRHPGCGPLAGIHAAMLASRSPWVFVVACDMPGLDPDVIGWLLSPPGTRGAGVPPLDDAVGPAHAL